LELVKNKKAFMFTLDAIFATILLIGGLLLISQYIVKEAPRESMQFVSTDLISALSEIKVGELNQTYVSSYLMGSSNTELNLSIIEQIGTYWAANEANYAQNLSKFVLNDMLPSNMGMNILIGSDVLFEKALANETTLFSSKRMITGIMQGAPLEGSTSSAYLRRINDKRTSSFAYFGGFIGQGNITFRVEDIPNDVSSNDVTSIILEVDARGSFDFYINGNFCKSFIPSNNNMTPNVWDVSECNASIISGTNKISLMFLSPLNESYVAGGFLKVNYKTDEMQNDFSSKIKRYYFPDVEGLINIYDSFYAQGIINSWIINLSFYNEYETFLVIGNETIFSREGRNYTQNVTYNKGGMSISPTTVPIRLGTRNFSNVTQIISGEAADTILITDVSGSMSNCGQWIDQLMCGYNCRSWWWQQCVYPGSCNDEECGSCWIWSAYNHQIFNDSVCNKTRLEVAQEADKIAVDMILNASANQVGLVSYSTGVQDYTDLTNDKTGLNSAIVSYSAGGGTCICCGINKAKDLLLSSSQKRFMIVLSDGDATYYCNSFSDYDGSGIWGGDGSGGSSSATDINWSIESGQEACMNNITVYAIGFGNGMSSQGHDTMKKIACNESLYYNATDVDQLEDIYRNISEEILTSANYTSQTISVSGNFSTAYLSGDSYIELNYTPMFDEPKQNEISLKMQTGQFNNCNAVVDIPLGIRIIDAKVTSYSGYHWTNILKVNSNLVYNLSLYNENYPLVGDPFILQVPSELLVNGTNTIYINTGDGPDNSTGCSLNNSLIYTALVPSSTYRSEVVEKTEGCTWTIQFEDDTNSTKVIPEDYTGNKTCSYTSTNYTLSDGAFDPTDAYDVAVFNLLRTLDFDDNGKVFVNLDAEDIEIVITTVSSVPYLWGPALIKIGVWQ